ncbi:MAG: S1-like domain-containing RNA-binding protein, partial [Bacteroidales bacterium]|nr:S1-like domain-containing RNA-binding protein [Bacteroidales bacterium]
MIEIGKYNDLRVNRFVDFGLYLIDDEANEVLLPKRYLTGEEQIDDMLHVFVYNDSENRPVATTETPYAVVGDFALMRVNQVNQVGAFLDWGLVNKELLVPFREQRVRMQAGRSYIVYVYIDDATKRIVASAKLNKFLDNKMPRFYHRQKVDVLVVQRTELGYKVIVDNLFWGLLYSNEIYGDINIGDRRTGFIKQVRDDGKIDVTLEKIEKVRVDDLGEVIENYLKKHGGEMTLNDKSDPKDIMDTFNCSKKDFKKALGLLYKQKKVTL